MILLDNKNKDAIVIEDKNITYREVISYTKDVSNLIAVEEKSHVLIFMENRPDYVYAIFGVWDKKCINVCVDASSNAKELSYFIENSDTNLIFTSDKNIEVVRAALKILEKDIKIINVDKIEYSKNLCAEDTKIVAENQDDVALILYTSGTTGNPKGVMLTFDNFKMNVEALDIHNMFTKDDRFLVLLPLHHILPLLGTVIVPIYKGATIIFIKEFSSQALLDAMKKHKVTIMIGVPKIWELMHKKIKEKVLSNAVSKNLYKLTKKLKCFALNKIIFKKVNEGFGGNIRYLVSGGSKLIPEIAEDFYAWGIKICEGYGMTETSPLISFNPATKIIPGSGGEIIKGVEAKISDDGEILVRGRNVMKGYYKNPEATAEIIDAEGFLHTGDLGSIKDNYVYITGRKKEMIVLSNGKNINPIEIEAKLILEGNLIKEVAVADINSVLTAIVYPDFQKIYDEKINNISEAIKWKIIDKYNRTVPDYKKILDIIVVKDELPKTKIGKIRRFVLKDFVKNISNEEVEIDEPKTEEYEILKNYFYDLKNRKISPKAHIQLDLGLDSLDMVEFLHFVETKFGIADKEIVLKYPIVEDLAEYISNNRSGEMGDDTDWSSILNQKIDNEMPKDNLFSIFMKPIEFILFNSYFRLKIKAKEKLSDKVCIYAGNHQSFLDGFLLNYAFSSKILKNTYYIAKDEHFKSKLRKFLGKHGNIVLVDVSRDTTAVLKIAAHLLKQNKNIVIFPEGARTRDGNLGKFKKSFAILAHELNVDIQPFTIKGAYEAFPVDTKFPKSAKIELEFLDRIKPEGKTYDEIVEEVREKISQNLNKK